jgi:hypothetical protein
VTGLVTILFGPLKKINKYRDAKGRLHRGTFFMRKVSIFNVSDKLISGPFNLTLDRLTKGVTLVNRTGVTRTQPPLGSPFVQSRFSGPTLASLQGGSLQLIFSNPRNRKIRFTPRLLAGIVVP